MQELFGRSEVLIELDSSEDTNLAEPRLCFEFLALMAFSGLM